MKKIILLLISTLLFSCGGGRNSDSPAVQVNCINNTATENSGTPNSIDLQILERNENNSTPNQPMKGVIVQLDHGGVCVRSNADGFVRFNALSNGKHDIHIFSPKGYSWRSFYNINTVAFYKFYLNKINYVYSPQKSYISLKGAINFISAGNIYSIYLITDKGRKYLGKKSIAALNSETNYAVDFEIPLPAGSSIKGDLIAYEYQYDSVSSESVLIDTAITTLSSLTFKTKATTGNYTSNNNANDINFFTTGSKPPATNLLTINNINIPEQLHLSSFNISASNNTSVKTLLKPGVSFFDFNDYSKNLIFPRNFKSIDPFNYTEINVTMFATLTNNYDNFWMYYNKFTKNIPAFTLTPQMFRIPTIQDNLVGNLITWDSVPPNLSYQYLWIGTVNNQNYKKYWGLTLDSKTISVRLPKIPNGVTPILGVGNNYKLRLEGTIDSTNYSEMFRVGNKTWKP